MAGWRLVVEPTLDDLIEDEIMVPVMRSAGTDAARLRAALAEIDRRRRGKAVGAPLRNRRLDEALCCS